MYLTGKTKDGSETYLVSKLNHAQFLVQVVPCLFTIYQNFSGIYGITADNANTKHTNRKKGGGTKKRSMVTHWQFAKFPCEVHPLSDDN